MTCRLECVGQAAQGGRAPGRGRSEGGCTTWVKGPRRRIRRNWRRVGRGGRSRRRRGHGPSGSPRPVEGRGLSGSTSVRISTATGPEGPRKVAARRFPMRSGYPQGPPAELAGQPRHEPDRQARGDVAGRRDGADRDRVDPGEGVAGAGGVEELRDQLAPAARPNQAVSRLRGLISGSSPRRSAAGSVPGSGRSRIAASIRWPGRGKALVEPGIVGPPEHEGEVGLEQRADRTRQQVDGLGAGAEHDPLAADLGEAGGGQVAERGDLGRDAAIGIVGARPRSPDTDNASSRCRARR